MSETDTATADPITDVEQDAPVTPPNSDETSGSAPEGHRDRLGRLRPILRSPALAALLALAVLVVGWAGVREYQSAQAQGLARRTDDAVLTAARQEVLALISLDGDTAQSQLDRAVHGATGGFRQQMQSEAAAFRSVVSGDKVVSTGKIDGIGVQKAAGAGATVLVAAEATVRNSANAKGELRLYRMSVTLERVNGRWLVGAVEMVS